MGFLKGCYGNSMVFLWDFHWIPMGFLWYFYDMPVGLYTMGCQMKVYKFKSIENKFKLN